MSGRTLRTTMRLASRPSPNNPLVSLVEISEKKEISESVPKETAKSSSSETKKGRRATPSKRKREDLSLSPRKSKAIRLGLDGPLSAPDDWEAVYNMIKDMRQSFVAPVDTMGCSIPMLNKDDEPSANRFATLISLMLSSQTKDEVTFAAISNLRECLGGLTLDNVLAADIKTIEEAICKVGFWRKKAKFIKQAATELRDNFNGDVPKTVDELCSLPGVGPKMAFLALQSAWDLNVGIGVDVHVHRITNRLGWHKPPTKNPEETRLNLQSWLPKDLHGAINPLLVGFGQVICLPVSPRCDLCKVSTAGLCPSAQVVRNPHLRKAIQTVQPDVQIELEDDDVVAVPHAASIEKPTSIESCVDQYIYDPKRRRNA